MAEQQSGETTVPAQKEHQTEENIDLQPRQVIAVSASKGPAAFFNLARKFLVTDEYCDLSALEGAIVAAVDAAHLLERSKLATIVRVSTSYVAVEPKRKKLQPTQGTEQGTPEGESPPVGAASPVGEEPERRSSRELRRARIVITVQRTESYKQWLDENPLQAAIAGDEEDEDLAQGTEDLTEPDER